MSESSPPPAEITCHATKWYLYRRVLPLSILPLLMSAYFFYDWKIGYPEKKFQYEEFERYQREGMTAEWPKYATEKGWPAKPDEMNQGKIDEQLYWGIGVGILGLWSLGYYLLSYPKKLRADATSFTPPWGPQIPFADVRKLDRRPWKHKGIAHVHYQRGTSVKKTSIDDLRFAGADQILERLEQNFTGEILDLEEEPEVKSEPEPAASSDQTGS